MNHREPPLPRLFAWYLAWATLVGLAGGAAITLAVTDAQSASRLQHAFLACPEPANESPGV